MEETAGSSSASRKGGLLALGVLVLLLLVPLPRAAEPNPFMEDLRNLLHVPLFFGVTLLVRLLLPSSSTCRRPVWICVFVAAVLGLLSEVLQGLTGRTPAVEDLGADLAGILLAGVALLWRTATRMSVAGWMMLFAGGGMFALAAAPLVGEISAHVAKRRAFPVLIGEGMPDGSWQGQGGTRLRVVEPGGLEVEMGGGDYEGLRHTIPRGIDTAGYSGMVIEVSNGGGAFELGVRVDVTSGRRKNAAVLIPRGESVLEVGWPRDAGDGDLRRVVLFTGVDQPARKFRLLKARLLRDRGRIPPPGP
jgi:VanZ family protein